MSNLNHHCIQFQQTVQLKLNTTPSPVKADGQIHRFSTKPGNVNDKAGWYVLFWNSDYNIACGVFGCWRSGLIKEKWCSREKKHLSEPEIKWFNETQKVAVDLQKKAKEEDNLRAKDEVKRILNAAIAPPFTHPYLDKKRIVDPIGAKLLNTFLLIPMQDINGEIWNVEQIYPSFKKRGLIGGKRNGLFFWFHNTDNDNSIIYTCEGWATGHSIFTATKASVICAFSCNNISKVAPIIRGKWPNSKIIIARDVFNNDDLNLTKIEEAAANIRASITYPKFDVGSTGSDFNDIFIEKGLDEVKKQLANNIVEPDVWPEIVPLEEDSEEPNFAEYLQFLPDDMRLAVEEAQKVVECPYSMVVSAALAVLSLAAQGLVNVKVSDYQIMPVSLFFLILAESGERKTTCYNLFFKVIEEWEERMEHSLAHDRVEYSSNKENIEATIRNLRNNLGKHKKNNDEDDIKNEINKLSIKLKELQPVRVPKIRHVDTSIEKFLKDLFVYPSTSLLSSEGGSIFSSYGIKETEANYLSKICSLWSDESIRIDRASSESYTLSKRRVTIWLGVQPDMFRTFYDGSTKTSKSSGFLARCLISYPKSLQGFRLGVRPKNTPHLNRFLIRIEELLNLKIDIDLNGGIQFKTLTLSREAEKIRRSFYEDIEKDSGECGNWSAIRDFASKATEQAVRIAGVFHVFEQGSNGEISEENMDNATTIARLFLNNAKIFNQTFIILNPIDKMAVDLKKWLINSCDKNKSNEINETIISNKGPNKVRLKENRAKVLERLEECGYIRILERGNQSTGDRRKSRRIMLNPELLSKPAK